MERFYLCVELSIIFILYQVFSIHININVRNIDIYLGTISYKDKCYKSERIRSVLRQLQPFCVRGVNFNNLSTYSLRRLCAVIHVRAAHFSKYPKIYNSIYIIRRVKQEQKKSSQFLLRCFGLRFFAPRQKLDRTKLFILTLYAWRRKMYLNSRVSFTLCIQYLHYNLYISRK